MLCAQMCSDELSHPTVIARAITRPCMLRQRSVTGHLRRSLDHYADPFRISRSTTCTRTVSLDSADGGHRPRPRRCQFREQTVHGAESRLQAWLRQ